jgi:lysophospholipase L1-like esterase
LCWIFIGNCSVAAAQGGDAPASAATQLPAQAAQATDPPRQQKDFADLQHYARANQALLSSRATQPRVVFMGDSITESWASVDADFFSASGYVDRGISGQTTPQMLLRFRQDVIALQAVVVHIMGGTNDIAGNTGPMELSETEANIASMVDLARANGIRVVLASVPPAAEFPWRPGQAPGPKIAALNEWLKHYAKAQRLVYADYYAALNDGKLGMKKDFSTDGVHPTLEGYRVMDPITSRAVQAALAQRPPP